MTEKEEIMEKARELGKAIRASDEYKELVEAQKNLDEDEETQELLNKYNTEAQKIQMKQLTGENIEEDIKKLRELEERIMDSETMKKYAEAEKKFKNLVDDANKAIVEAMEKEE